MGIGVLALVRLAPERVAGRAPEARTAATALILANLNAHFAEKPLPSPVSFKA